MNDVLRNRARSNRPGDPLVEAATYRSGGATWPWEFVRGRGGRDDEKSRSGSLPEAAPGMAGHRAVSRCHVWLLSRLPSRDNRVEVRLPSFAEGFDV